MADNIRSLRRAGERAAHRLGLSRCDAEAVGVDFAAYMLIYRLPGLPRHHCTPCYVNRAAHWFAAKEARAVRTSWLALTEDGDLPELRDPDHTESEWISRLMLKQLLEQANRLMRRRPAADQFIFQSCILGGATSEEIALQLGCSAAATRKRLQRLRSYLREMLSPSLDPGECVAANPQPGGSVK